MGETYTNLSHAKLQTKFIANLGETSSLEWGKEFNKTLEVA